MKSERIFEAITNANESFIDEAKYPLKSKIVPIIRKTAGIAAIFAVVLIAVGIINQHNQTGYSVSTTSLGTSDRASNFTSGSTETAESYSSVSAPVLPLTASNGENITSGRQVTLDLTSETRNGTWFENVTDEYTLENTTENDIETVLYYPFVTSLRDAMETKEGITLTVDGEKTAEEFLIGGEYQDKMSLLPTEYDISEAYEEAVTVYEIQNIKLGENYPDAVTIAVSMDIDMDNTSVFTYGFNGGEYDYANGKIREDFFAAHADEPIYMIVVGDDVSNVSLQGYINGGCEEGDEFDATADYVKYTSTLGEMAEKICRIYMERSLEKDKTDDALVLPMTAALLNQMIGTDFDMLEEDLVRIVSKDYLCYISVPVTISAGETVNVKAEFEKAPSYNYYGSGRNDTRGYSLVPQEGSSLIFDEVNVKLIGGDELGIISENFNFDDSGEATLRGDDWIYYLNVTIE